jgi:hypothetical protein
MQTSVKHEVWIWNYSGSNVEQYRKHGKLLKLQSYGSTNVVMWIRKLDIDTKAEQKQQSCVFWEQWLLVMCLITSEVKVWERKSIWSKMAPTFGKGGKYPCTKNKHESEPKGKRDLGCARLRWIQSKVKLSLSLNKHHSMIMYWWSEGILNLGTRWRWVVSFTPQQLYPRYLLDRKLGELSSRSGRDGEKISHHFSHRELKSRRPGRSPFSVLTELPWH